MDTTQILNEDIDSWETAMFLYNSALKEVGTKLDILNDEFVHIHKYNPIEYIKKRIKTPESIVKKLKRDNYEVHQRYRGNPHRMFIYFGYLPSGRDDRKTE